jgi:hypothetical protein
MPPPPPRAPPLGADLTELVAAWCRGAKFADLHKPTDVF